MVDSTMEAVEAFCKQLDGPDMDVLRELVKVFVERLISEQVDGTSLRVVSAGCWNVGESEDAVVEPFDVDREPFEIVGATGRRIYAARAAVSPSGRAASSWCSSCGS